MTKVLQVLAIAIAMIALIMWRFSADPTIMTSLDKGFGFFKDHGITPDRLNAALGRNNQKPEQKTPETPFGNPNYGYIPKAQALYSDNSGKILVTKVPAHAVVKVEQVIPNSDWVLIKYKQYYGALLKSNIIFDTNPEFPFKKPQQN